MIGTQSVRIMSGRVSFTFEVRRSITIVRGDSGSGKTTLFDMVASHTRLGDQSGVSIQCQKRCVALVDIDWKNQLSNTKDSIVFIDEGAKYVTSEDFASAIKRTDNYYVIFTREDLHELAYSVNEIYRIKTSGKKYHTFERLYKPSDRHIYSLVARRRGIAEYNRLLTEDSKAGFEFYQARFSESGVSCESAGNNSSIYGLLKEDHDGTIFVVADGAAFGSQIDRVLKLQRAYPLNISVCLPESFEWLLLNSGLVDAPDLSKVLEDTGAHVDSSAYFSWERFYTAYLTRISQGTPFAYSKNQLAQAYLIPENAEKIMKAIATANIR